MMDTQTRNELVKKWRAVFMTESNKTLSGRLVLLAEHPRQFTAVEREALLYVAANRLWGTEA